MSSWFSGWSSGPTASTPAAPVNVKSAAVPENKPRPCCVCKEEKSARDDCMLFSKSDDPAQTDCKSTIEQYKSCMAGFGFQI